MRELVKKACVKLRAAQLPPAWTPVEEALPPRCTAKSAQIRCLMESVRWQDQIPGPSQDRIVILDGKKVHHGGLEIVNAVRGR